MPRLSNCPSCDNPLEYLKRRDKIVYSIKGPIQIKLQDKNGNKVQKYIQKPRYCSNENIIIDMNDYK